jgi:hypothetical protein
MSKLAQETSVRIEERLNRATHVCSRRGLLAVVEGGLNLQKRRCRIDAQHPEGLGQQIELASVS